MALLNGLSLFSGIGGIDIALRDWVRPIAYCEIDPYCQSVLLQRMQEGNLPKAPIWSDVQTLSRDMLYDGGIIYYPIDIIYGGFPCQDISVAGAGKGLEGKRSGLFFEIMRLVGEIKPKWIFLENVDQILSRGCDTVITSLSEIGYDCRYDIFSARKFIDQDRKRWFCLAKLNSKRREQGARENIRQEKQNIITKKPSNYKLSSMEGWAAYSRSMRKDSRIPNRMERIKALGNSVCPEQTRYAFCKLIGLNYLA